LQALLADLAIRVVTPQELGLQLRVIEDGASYKENASKKATKFALASGLTALADDSGLEVEVLAGAPGLYSNRYLADLRATDADRRAFLLSQLHGKPRPWLARFRSVVAIAAAGQYVHCEQGECPGEIIPQERGTHGFGYDPIFLVAGTDCTMAELPLEQKNTLSHRAQALKKARPVLIETFGL
jgi:XTP/dITP diphosphohydrolase